MRPSISLKRRRLASFGFSFVMINLSPTTKRDVAQAKGLATFGGAEQEEGRSFSRGGFVGGFRGALELRSGEPCRTADGGVSPSSLAEA